MLGELESLDERAALADGLGEIEPDDAGKLLRHVLHHAERVVAAAVEHDDDGESAGIIAPEKLRVVAQHRFNAAFLVVGRDEEQQAGVRHWDLIAKIREIAIAEGLGLEMEMRF